MEKSVNFPVKSIFCLFKICAAMNVRRMEEKNECLRSIFN